MKDIIMDWNVVLDIVLRVVTSKSLLLFISISAHFISIIALYGLIVLIVNERIYYKKTEKSMQEVDSFGKIIHRYLVSHYLTLAKEYFGDDYFNHIESFVYTYSVKEPLKSIKREFRRRIRKNGFEKKDPKDWMKYVEDCIQEDHAEFTKGLDNAYYVDSIIPRPKLFEHNKKIADYVDKEYKELFEKLLEIANSNRYRKFFKWEINFHS